jgi:hypothetical protein
MIIATTIATFRKLEFPRQTLYATTMDLTKLKGRGKVDIERV